MNYQTLKEEPAVSAVRTPSGLSRQVGRDLLEEVLFSNRDKLLYSTDISLANLAEEIFPSLNLACSSQISSFQPLDPVSRHFLEREIISQLTFHQILRDDL